MSENVTLQLSPARFPMRAPTRSPLSPMSGARANNSPRSCGGGGAPGSVLKSPRPVFTKPLRGAAPGKVLCDVRENAPSKAKSPARRKKESILRLDTAAGSGGVPATDSVKSLPAQFSTDSAAAVASASGLVDAKDRVRPRSETADAGARSAVIRSALKLLLRESTSHAWEDRLDACKDLARHVSNPSAPTFSNRDAALFGKCCARQLNDKRPKVLAAFADLVRACMARTELQGLRRFAAAAATRLDIARVK